MIGGTLEAIGRWLYSYRAIGYAALIPLMVAHALGGQSEKPVDEDCERRRVMRKRQRALDAANGPTRRTQRQ